MTEHGFRMEDMRDVFKKCDPYNWDSAIRRLTTMKISGLDEGYLHLMDDPPALESMKDFFYWNEDISKQMRRFFMGNRNMSTNMVKMNDE